MKSTISAEQQDHGEALARMAVEHFASAVASRYGFRPQDFFLVWDGGHFDASRREHEMLVTSNDGRSAAARIDDEALLRQDAWKYLREVDGAFAKLARRGSTRGL